MLKLDSGKFFGSQVVNRHVGGIWASLARYDESLISSTNNQSNDWHAHQNPHFSFILEGGNLEQRKGFSTDCLPGRVLFYHSGELHQNVNVLYPSKNFNVEIDENFLSKYDLTELAIDSKLVSDSEIKFTMLRIYKEVIYQSEITELAVHSLILGTITKKEIIKKGSAGQPCWVGKIIEVLNDRWNENFSLSGLSQAAGVHPTTISKHFPKYFSCTLGEYVRRLRVERSFSLIKQSNLSLTDVALECGFADQSHFIRVFKNLTGLLPSTFRRI